MSLREHKAMVYSEIKQYQINCMSNEEQDSEMLFDMEYQHSDSDHLFTDPNKKCHDADAPKQGEHMV
jgi:hypothetical protein